MKARVEVWMVVALSAGCIDTNLDPPVFLPCASALSAELAREAVVAIEADPPEGFLLCSGVAIAKTLVITNISCVFRPSEIGDPDEITPPEEVEFFPDAIYPSVAYDSACGRDEDWGPIEDGTFLSSFGKPLNVPDLSVSKIDAPEQPFDVRQVYTSNASSRCASGIALLVLARELDVTPIPIRFEDTSQQGEAVTLGGRCFDAETRLVRQELDASIEVITEDEAEEAVSPRSLLLSQGVATPSIGGAVFSPSSGALIGVISSGTGSPRCSTGEPGADILAVRVAPFRRMLLEVAEKESISLRSELDSGAGRSSVCDADESPELITR
jgi:hypothetical protein